MIRTRLARALRRLADRLDPPAAAPTTTVETTTTSVEPDDAAVQAMIDDMTLRNALHRALRRYSPTERFES